MKKRKLELFPRRFIMSWVAAIAFLPWVTFASGQDVQTVRGRITDEKGVPIPSVSVFIKGTSSGTMSDNEGNYIVPVPKNIPEPVVLQFSYVGFANKEETVGNRSLIDVSLSEDVSTLDEIVVVGYGVQRKSVVTAAISRITGDDLELITPTRIEDVLKGKVSGVQIIQDSGQPNSGSRVRIRGTGTINNSDPLYIVDGMPINGGISYLNPSDIESVEVLKDAASAAIYGTRGANGVLLVTTKQGGEGRSSLNYDFSYGWQNPWKKKAVLDAREYMIIQNEMAVNDGGVPRYSKDDIANAITTDWQDETFNYNAPVKNHQISINGGNEKNRYFLSFGYFNREGIVGGNVSKSNYERYSVRLNDTYTVLETKERKFLNKVRIGTNLAYSRANSSNVEANSEWGSILGSAITFDPTLPVLMTAEETAAQLALPTDAYPYNYTVLNEDGLAYTTPPTGFQEIGNPVGMLHQPTSSRANEDKFVSTLWGEIEICDGLKFRSSYGTDLAFWGEDSSGFPYFLSVQGKWLTPENSYVESEMNRGFSWQVENYFSYEKVFNGTHTFSAVLGQSAMRASSKNLGGRGVEIPTTDPNKAWIDNTIGGDILETSWGGVGDVTFRSLASYFFRFNYNYAERYMFQASMRYDGSSRFGPQRKWASFPSLSLGWNVLNEPYLEDFKPRWFNVLKIRTSWGKNGNENIPELRYASFDQTGKSYFFGGRYHVGDGSWAGDATEYPGIFPSNLFNPTIRWEESNQIDFGIDLRFFGNALNFSADYFNKKTKGMLIDVPIPRYVGQGAPTGNVGEMENSGFEFEIGWKGKACGFQYYVTANASYVKNKLISIGNAAGELYYDSNGASGVGTYVKASDGDVFPYFYGLKTGGLFQNQAEIDAYTFIDTQGNTKRIQPNAKPGDVRFVDINNDGQINDNDKTKIGKPMPDLTYGFTVGGEWKGFDFNLFFQGTVGNDMFEFAQRGDIAKMNRPEWILQRWHGEGTSNKIPRMTQINENENWRSSDLYIKNGAYMRLKTAQLGYTLPAYLTKKAAIQRLRFFVAAENLLTFTGYEGFDPEIAGGIDRGVYPQSRTVSLGINVSF